MNSSTQNEEQAIDLDVFLESVRIEKQNEDYLAPMITDEFRLKDEKASDATRFVSTLATLIWNVDNENDRLEKSKIQALISYIDQMVNDQINEIIHDEKFKKIEANWIGLYDLLKDTNFKANVMIDLLDASKEELAEDFENHSVDFTGSALFSKVYNNEYEQYGGLPFGSLIGLYDFNHTPQDEFWLKMMGKIANASHAPFISSVSTRFFGCETTEELASIKDLEGLMNHPKYGSFNAFRESEEAAYIGLCLPKYILRKPWDPLTNPTGKLNFVEYTWGDEDEKYLWGNSAILLAKNLVASFEQSGWCQYIRGPKGGGLVPGLPVHTFNIRGEDEIKIPTEIMIPDYRELEYANCGFIPLVYRKGTSDACFFSVQSLKKPKEFEDPKDSENAQLVCNLAYTFSITRIAHYVKAIMRDNIGSSADASYIQTQLNNWLLNYVTTVTNPDDLTLRYFPFKAAEVVVVEKPGKIGWYSCSISVLPHVQMEGMDVELRLESRLG